VLGGVYGQVANFQLCLYIIMKIGRE